MRHRPFSGGISVEYILPLLSIFISLISLCFSYTATYSEEVLLRKLKKQKFDFILVPNQQYALLSPTQFIEKLRSLPIGENLDTPQIIQNNFKTFYACNSKNLEQGTNIFKSLVLKDTIFDICQSVIVTRQGKKKFKQNPFFINII